MKSKTLSQILKFTVVGGFNTAIDLAVLNFLIFILNRGGSGIYFTLFKSISFAIATANSYLMNKYWTFSASSSKKAHIEIGQFLFISAIGLLVNVFVASIF